MADPRKAKFNATPTVAWSDGSVFNGYILIGIQMPSQGGTDYPFVAMGGSGQDFYPIQRVPTFALTPIKSGKYDINTTIFFNSDLNPPNSVYRAWLYDDTRRQVAGPSSSFTVSADPFTPPTLTPTIPTTGATTPTPDT